jgi:hypothetical protein
MIAEFDITSFEDGGTMGLEFVARNAPIINVASKHRLRGAAANHDMEDR